MYPEGAFAIFPDEIILQIMEDSPELMNGIFCRRLYDISHTARIQYINKSFSALLDSEVENGLITYYFNSRARLHRWVTITDALYDVIFGLNTTLRINNNKVVLRTSFTKMVFKTGVGLVLQTHPKQLLEIRHEGPKKRIVTGTHTIYVSSNGEILTFPNTDIIRLFTNNYTHRLPRPYATRDIKLFRKWLHNGKIYDNGARKLINKRKHLSYLRPRGGQQK